MWWVIHMCRGFDPLFWHSGDRNRSFWGTFSHPPTPKLSFGVLKLPILTEFDLFGLKFYFSLDLFGSNFQRPAAHPHQFSDRVPPPGGHAGVLDDLILCGFMCAFSCMFQYSLCHGMDIGTCNIVHWSAAPHNRIANRTGFSVYVLVLNVIRYSCHYFLDRILFHHDFHHDSCDYHWDFYGH